ncbi:MAG: hypothetical protein FJ279_30770, partial [Planctomycetes bacterium]|nr:hypothetical protein [Planctomycetota bacterium]
MSIQSVADAHGPEFARGIKRDSPVWAYLAAVYGKGSKEPGVQREATPAPAVAQGTTTEGVQTPTPSPPKAAELPIDPADFGLTLVGKIYEVRPPNMRFARPVTLTMTYTVDDLRVLKNEGAGTPRTAKRPSPPRTEKDGQQTATPGKAAAVAQSPSPSTIAHRPSTIAPLIYEYQPVEQFWRPLACKVDVEKKAVAAQIASVPRYVAFYALLADFSPPSPPRFTAFRSGPHTHDLTVESGPMAVQRGAIALEGEAEPEAKVGLVALAAKGNSQEDLGETPADSDGMFRFENVRLPEGVWQLGAYATDAAGNRSEASSAVAVAFRRQHPKSAKSLEILGPASVSQGQRLVVCLKGEDADPNAANSTLAHVSSSLTDPKGFDLELVETGAATGTYVSTIRVKPNSDPASGEIGALTHEEVITASALPAGFLSTVLRPLSREKRDSITYADRIPPSVPVIRSPSHPSLCQDTFELDQGQWAGRDGMFGAILKVESTGDQNRFLVANCDAWRMRSHLGATGRSSPYSLKEFPVISFDYLLRSGTQQGGTQLDLLAKLQVGQPGWRGVKLTDVRPFYPRFGKVFGAVADDRWHHAEFDLLSMVRKAYPGTSDCVVDELAFMNLDDAGFMRREYGAPGGPYEAYRIDNFRIFRYSDKPDVTFVFGASDENGIAGFSCSLDHDPNTQPDEAVDEVEPLTEKDRESVKVRLGGERESDGKGSGTAQ